MVFVGMYDDCYENIKIKLIYNEHIKNMTQKFFATKIK